MGEQLMLWMEMMSRSGKTKAATAGILLIQPAHPSGDKVWPV